MKTNKNKLIPENISMEKLDTYKKDYCTVGTLMEFINDKLKSGELTKDSLVLSQRIEDIYFEEHNWKVIRKEDHFYHQFLKHNKRIDEGYYLNKEQFPDIKEGSPIFEKYSEEELEQAKSQYYPVFCPIFYRDDKNLFLNSHY